MSRLVCQIDQICLGLPAETTSGADLCSKATTCETGAESNRLPACHDIFEPWFRYRDGEHPDEDVVFVVTCQPFIVGSTVTLDAGLIAYHDDAAFSDKNSSIVPLRTFTQSMIDGGMVAYVPPMTDIGPHPLNVKFIYSVSDLHGNFEVDKTFDVTVLPVNNQVRCSVFCKNNLYSVSHAQTRSESEALW